MPLPSGGTIYRALNTSISEAVESGRIDRNAQAALIAAARKVARVMDDPEWPIIKGKYDNVSPSMLLKYCEALGICPKFGNTEAKAVRSSLAAARDSLKVVRMRA